MNHALCGILPVVVVAALLPACKRADLQGPPNIRLGRDECADCGMLLSEARCSCALLAEVEGRRTYLVFDDLGCMLDHRAEHPEFSVVGTFVHDYAAGGWVSGESARYLVASPNALKTPMGSGMVAFASQAGAEEQRKRTGGEMVDFIGLATIRRSGALVNDGAPGGAP